VHSAYGEAGAALQTAALTCVSVFPLSTVASAVVSVEEEAGALSRCSAEGGTPNSCAEVGSCCDMSAVEEWTTGANAAAPTKHTPTWENNTSKEWLVAVRTPAPALSHCVGWG
jgi:hypothetical protein